MKRGGEIIYSGALGHHSKNIIEYFEVENQDLIPCIGPSTIGLLLERPSLQGSLCKIALL